MDEKIKTVVGLLNQTAKTLGQSFTHYWPADDINDPVDRNVSLHFAHAMLSAGFSTFAEADHPNRGPIRGIDIFGLSPDNTWFLGCEFKRLYSAEKLLSMVADIQRLVSFRPRVSYSLEIFGPTYSAAASCCKHGYGLVGGLHWVSGKKQSSPILDIWLNPNSHSGESTYGQIIETMKMADAILPEPQIVIQLPTGNRYYLLAAVFPVPYHLCEA